MFDELLERYNDNDYVYIIDGCMNWRVSLKPCSDRKCPVCGEYDWSVTEGFVNDLKLIKNIEELEKYQQNKCNLGYSMTKNKRK